MYLPRSEHRCLSLNPTLLLKTRTAILQDYLGHFNTSVELCLSLLLLQLAALLILR